MKWFRARREGRPTVRIATALLVLLLLATAAPAAFAQGCALCRTSAAGLGEEGQKALDLAILVLLVPTLSIFVGVLLFALRYRNRSLSDQNQTDNAALPLVPPVTDSSLFRPARHH